MDAHISKLYMNEYTLLLYGQKNDIVSLEGLISGLFPVICISFAITEEMKTALEKIAAQEHIPPSELIRKHLDHGMDDDKKRDTDFTRNQIREEHEIIMKKQTGRSMSLQYKIGICVIPQDLFTAESVHIVFRLKEGDKASFSEMWKRSKREAAVILHARNETIDGPLYPNNILPLAKRFQKILCNFLVHRKSKIKFLKYSINSLLLLHKIYYKVYNVTNSICNLTLFVFGRY